MTAIKNGNFVNNFYIFLIVKGVMEKVKTNVLIVTPTKREN